LHACFTAGPCSSNELFFPRGENTATGIGSCYRVGSAGRARFHEVSSVCAGASNRGSAKSPLSKRDPEIHLLLGALNFLRIYSTPYKYISAAIASPQTETILQSSAQTIN
jgi:hypothetical protein